MPARRQDRGPFEPRGPAKQSATGRALGLKPYTSFAQLTSDPDLQQELLSVYGSIDQVDLFMGGLAEAHACGAVVGSTFKAIIGDQFERLRTGDRFFWRNQASTPGPRR